MRLHAIVIGAAGALLGLARAGSTQPLTPVPARSVELRFPLGVAVLANGDVLIAERAGHRVSRWAVATGTVHVVAGSGTRGFGGDGGAAAQATLACADAVDADTEGNIYVADRCNERIRRIDRRTGDIATIAGTGTRGPGPDGPAIEARLTGVYYLRVVQDTLLLFTDTDAHLIRELNLRTGMIATVAGSGVRGNAGDGGPARAAQLNRPHVAARLRNGDLVIGDSFNHRIRIVDARTGIIRTLVGSGEQGSARDGAGALETPLLYFGEILELPDGDLLWSEWGSGQFLRLNRRAQTVHVVAGRSPGTPPGRLSGLRDVELGSTADIAFDAQGRLVIASAESNLIRRLDFERQSVEVLAGRSP